MGTCALVRTHHTYIHICIHIHTDRYMHWCLPYALDRMHYKKTNITFRQEVRCKKSQGRLNMYAGMYPTQTYTHTHRPANGCTHASACKQTDRRTDACAHAACMTTFIPTDRQVHGGLPAHTHAQMHTYVRTYIIHTYLLFVRFDTLRSGQQFFSYVGRTDLPGLNQY